MAAGGSAAELFLADSANGVVRAFDVRSGRLDARDAYRRSDGNQSIVSAAYSARSDTLFVCTSFWNPCPTLRPLVARANAEWRECHCLEVGVVFCGIQLRALSDGSLVLIKVKAGGKSELQVLAADAARAMRQQRLVADTSVSADFDATLAAGGEIWLADAEKGAVAIHRVVEAGTRCRTEELSRCALANCWRPLFCGHDSLLAYARTADAAGWEVHELGVGAGGRLEPRRAILCGRDLPGTEKWKCWPEWCVANDALVAWNLEHRTLTSYSLQ